VSSHGKTQSIIGLGQEASVSQNAQLIVRRRLEEFSRWSTHAESPYAIKELHQLRIATKRLRYTLEIFVDFFSDGCKFVIEEMRALQDELGVLHESDVFIALLRMCLFCQDNPACARRLRRIHNNHAGMFSPALVAALLDPETAPSAAERYGLEWVLRKQEHIREEQYSAFYAHWSRLQEQDFHRRVLDWLEEERSDEHGRIFSPVSQKGKQ
jgi:hypothetical protein